MYSLTARGWLGKYEYSMRGFVRHPYPCALIPKHLHNSVYYSIKGWCYQMRRTWHGIQPTAMRPPISTQPKTADQEAWKQVFADGSTAWLALTSLQKGVWNSYRYPPRMSGYNKFMREYLRTHEAAPAGIEFDAVSSDSGGGDSLTFAHTCSGSNRLLVVGISISDSNSANRPVTSVTYNGVALTKIASVDTGAGTSERVEMWYLINPASGEHNVIINTTGILNFISAGAISLTGAKQSGQPDASNTASDSSLEATVTVTTVANNSLVIDALCSEPAPTVDASQTERWNIEGQAFQHGAGSTEGPKTPAGDVEMSWSLAYGARWRQIGASFAPL